MQEQNRAGRNLLCFVKLQLGIGISSLLPIFLWLEQMICLMSVDQENILHPEGEREGGREYLLKNNLIEHTFIFIFIDYGLFYIIYGN